jgi:ABC-type multidrug transport system ATPase subunit
MSEEILKALMQLFALIVKQDGGVEANEREYVHNFLNQQLSEEVASQYLKLFDEHAGIINGVIPPKETQPTSVRDSVRILGICKKINRTLTQQQKVVVLVRLYELVNAEGKFTEQRLNVINTVAEVFKFAREEFNDIESFVKSESFEELNSHNILILTGEEKECQTCKALHSDISTGFIFFLHIRSVDLYFLKIRCTEEVSLNGMALRKDRIYLFAHGSTLKFQYSKAIYYSDIVENFITEASSIRISYHCNNISYRFPDGVYGIRNINFAESQGKMVGIMGTSGSGKTTLLNILTGLESPSEGNIIVNGIDLHRDQKNLEGVIGYIPQDDLLIEDLTVFENLYYNARLCFNDKNTEEITDIVDHTLQSLGLYEKKNLKVGSTMNKVISGGQRKRLNIALELIREPSILFVDEPTSGLSSRDSDNVMDLLRELALKGKLVFVVIHQPSSDIFKLFDNVLVLDTGGYMIYYGNPIETVIYFKTMDGQINSDIGQCPACGNVNPEIVFNIIDGQVVDEFGRYTSKRKVSPERWEQKFRETVTMPKIALIQEKPPSTLKIPGRIKQFTIYLLRDFFSKIANHQYLILTLTEAPLLAFILSYIVRYIADPNSEIYIFRENENIPIYIFMSLIVALFIGLTVSAEEIFRDRKILKREAFLNLSRTSYLFSKIVILFTLSALQALVFVLIGNSILGIRDMYLEYWLAFFTTATFANMLGLNVSISFNSAITIYIVIPLLVIPMMVLSGAMFSFDKLNRKINKVGEVPIIADLMATKWTYEALMVTQFRNNKYEKKLYPVEQVESNAYFMTVEYIPYLQQALNEVVDDFNLGKLKPGEEGKLPLLRNEIKKEMNRVREIPFEFFDQLTPSSFNEVISSKTMSYFDALNQHYSDLSQRASLYKEAILDKEDEENPEVFRNLRKNYHNERVEEIVKNIYERHNILEYKNQLIRQYQPVFFDPEPHGYFDFRSHFFAPDKYFMGRYHDTFRFNMSVVWIMTLLLYFALYLELFKRIFLFFEKYTYKKFKYLSRIAVLKNFRYISSSIEPGKENQHDQKNPVLPPDRGIDDSV